MSLHRPESPPSPEEQQLALSSYDALSSVRDQLTAGGHPQIILADHPEPIELPRHAFELLIDILRFTGKGKAVTVVPETAEMTTQAAANYLGCSRPHLVKLLENGEIAYHKIGRHRRISFSDLAAYKQRTQKHQRALLGDMMADDEADQLYGA